MRILLKVRAYSEFHLRSSSSAAKPSLAGQADCARGAAIHPQNTRHTVAHKEYRQTSHHRRSYTSNGTSRHCGGAGRHICTEPLRRLITRAHPSPRFLGTTPIHEGPVSRELGHVSSALAHIAHSRMRIRRQASGRYTFRASWCTRVLATAAASGAAPARLRSAPLLSLLPWVRRLAATSCKPLRQLAWSSRGGEALRASADIPISRHC